MLLNTRVEIRGLRADGSEVPVELTVTRVQYEDDLIFMAYIRDITARVAASRPRAPSSPASSRSSIETTTSRCWQRPGRPRRPAAALGGTVAVDSPPGAGTTPRARLPVP